MFGLGFECKDAARVQSLVKQASKPLAGSVGGGRSNRSRGCRAFSWPERPSLGPLRAPPKSGGLHLQGRGFLDFWIKGTRSRLQGLARVGLGFSVGI